MLCETLPARYLAFHFNECCLSTGWIGWLGNVVMQRQNRFFSLKLTHPHTLSRSLLLYHHSSLQYHLFLFYSISIHLPLPLFSLPPSADWNSCCGLASALEPPRAWCLVTIPSGSKGSGRRRRRRREKCEDEFKRAYPTSEMKMVTTPTGTSGSGMKRKRRGEEEQNEDEDGAKMWIQVQDSGYTLKQEGNNESSAGRPVVIRGVAKGSRGGTRLDNVKTPILPQAFYLSGQRWSEQGKKNYIHTHTKPLKNTHLGKSCLLIQGLGLKRAMFSNSIHTVNTHNWTVCLWALMCFNPQRTAYYKA